MRRTILCKVRYFQIILILIFIDNQCSEDHEGFFEHINDNLDNYSFKIKEESSGYVTSDSSDVYCESITEGLVDSNLRKNNYDFKSNRDILIPNLNEKRFGEPE